MIVNDNSLIFVVYFGIKLKVEDMKDSIKPGTALFVNLIVDFSLIFVNICTIRQIDNHIQLDIS